MDTNYIKSTIILILAFTCNTIFAEPLDAEYQKLAETWTLHANGSQEYRRSMELTLYTHIAMNYTYGETFICYNPKYQNLKIHTSYTKQKDGTIIQTPDNAFVEVLPRNAENAPAYNHLKEMVIVHTGLELGATIFLDYSIISKPGYLPELDLYKEFPQISPVKNYTLTLSVPKNKSVGYEQFNFPIKPSVSYSDNIQQIRWEIHNLPAKSHAPMVSLKDGDIPGLLVSTYPSAKDALQTLYAQFNAPKDPQLQTVAEALTENSKTDVDRLHAILDYVTNQYSTCRLSISETGYRLRNADAVINSAYGTEIEMINLLYGLLNAIDIDAQPIAVYNFNNEPKVYGLNGIKEFLVLAYLDNKQYVLYPTNKKITGNFKDKGLAINLCNGETTILTPLSSDITYQAEIDLTSQNYKASIASTFGNQFTSFFGNNIDFIPKLSNSQKETQNNQEIIKGELSTPLKEKNGYILMSFPSTTVSFSGMPYASFNTGRKENLMLPYCPIEKYVYTIHIPENMDLCTPDKEKKIDNNVGSLLVSINTKGKTVKITRSIEIKKQFIKADDYAEFRLLMTEWADPNEQQLLFKCIK